jgi:hypothetical protein
MLTANALTEVDRPKNFSKLTKNARKRFNVNWRSRRTVKRTQTYSICF